MSTAQKVNILLSTYNGQKYLVQQLDSLLAQTYENITIYIRDDGSSDNTLDVLTDYMDRLQPKSAQKIILMDQDDPQNLGYMESFWTLLRNSDQADYYAFCDQDDIWLPDKVKQGVEALEAEDPSLPLLYSSSFAYVNEEAAFDGSPVPLKTPVLFKDVLFYTPAFGFTIMINQKLREAALQASSLKNIPHDGWCQKIAASMGRFIYDPTQTAKYRRHSSTVTYAGSHRLQMVGKWLKNDILGIGLSEYHFILQRFYEEYADRMQPSDRRCLELFRKQRTTPALYLKRLFFARRLRPSLGGELALRLCFLLNR